MPAEISLEALAGDTQRLKYLQQSTEYETYVKYLEIMSEDLTAQLANFYHRSHDQDVYDKGRLAGLKMASMVPEHVAETYQKALEGRKKT